MKEHYSLGWGVNTPVSSFGIIGPARETRGTAGETRRVPACQGASSGQVPSAHFLPGTGAVTALICRTPRVAGSGSLPGAWVCPTPSAARLAPHRCAHATAATAHHRRVQLRWRRHRQPADEQLLF